MRILVTGGAGFIGSWYVRELLAIDPAAEVVVLDKLTYAGNPRFVDELANHPRFRFIRGDIADRALVRRLLAEVGPGAVVHFAAESHVDRSIVGSGTFHLLDEVRGYLDARPAVRDTLRFVHVSTDEVYGALGDTGSFVETSRYDPRSPYAASKAASDHMVAAYVHTYDVPAIITSCCNNYGPYQFPEKLIPLVIANALAGKPLPVYGTGRNVRDWIHVADHCSALRAVVARGEPGERYVIGARCERTNLDVVHAICDLLDEVSPAATPRRELIRFVTDRKGHDFRYAIDPSKLETELGWRPTISFADGLRDTVRWYAEHRDWFTAMREVA